MPSYSRISWSMLAASSFWMSYRSFSDFSAALLTPCISLIISAVFTLGSVDWSFLSTTFLFLLLTEAARDFSDFRYCLVDYCFERASSCVLPKDFWPLIVDFLSFWFMVNVSSSLKRIKSFEWSRFLFFNFFGIFFEDLPFEIRSTA